MTICLPGGRSSGYVVCAHECEEEEDDDEMYVMQAQREMITITPPFNPFAMIVTLDLSGSLKIIICPSD